MFYDPVSFALFRRMGSGGSGGGHAADWNQNDPSQPDYVKNRTHYESVGLVELPVAGQWNVLDETDEDGDGTIDRTYYQFQLSAPIGLEVGKTYTVSWNGTDYICVALDLGELSGGEMPGVHLGNLAPMGGEDTGEPFMIQEASAELAAQIGAFGAIIATDFSGNIPFAIKQEQAVAVPLPTKFLPASVPWVETGVVEILPETTVTFGEDGDQTSEPVTDAFDIKIGGKYEVNWNGVSYECTAQSFDKEGMHIGATLGNQVFYGESDTGEPFALMFIDPSMIAMIGASFTAMALDGSAQAVVSVFGEGAKVNKLDNRCLDLAWLPTTKEELKEVYPETTMTFTYGGSQFFQAHEIPIELVVGNQYIVTFEGTEYPCEAKVIGDESVSIYYIGNIALNYPNEPDLAPNTGEPFVYSVQDVGGDDNGARFYIEGEFTGDEYTAERTIAVYAVVQVPNKLPAEFLPDELYLTSPGGKKFKITVSDDGVLSAAAAT